MKTAVVLTGHLRCWKMVFPNFKERVIDRYNPDIFIHTWDNEGWWVPQEGAKGIHEGSDALDTDDARAHYNPVRMEVEHFDDLHDQFAARAAHFTNFYHRPRNIVSMFYKMIAGMNLLQEHVARTGAAYDLVIRMRPDMILHEPLPEFDPARFYTLAHRNHMGGGTGDMFQIGSLWHTVLFSKISLCLEGLYAQTKLLCPHVVSVQHIQNMNLPWQEFTINKTIQHTPAGQYRAV